MSIFSRIGGAVKSAYRSVDRSVFKGALPGGAPKTSSSSRSSSTSTSSSTSSTSSGGGSSSSGGGSSSSSSGGSGKPIQSLASGKVLTDTGEEITQAEAQRRLTSSSGGSSAPQTIQQTSKSPAPSVVDLPQSQSLGDAAASAKLQIQQKGIKGIPDAAKILFAAGTNKQERDLRNYDRDKVKTQKDLERLNFGKPQFSQQDVQKAYKGYSGTAESFSTKPYTASEVTTLAASGQVSPSAAIKYIANQESRTSEIKVTQLAVNEKNKINKEIPKIQEQINSGTITYEQGTQRLNQLQSEANERIQKVADSETQRIEGRLKKVVPEIKLQKAIFSVPLIAAAGFAGGAVLGLAPAAIQTTAAVGGGLYAAKEASELAQDVGAGKAGLKDVATFGISGAAFAGGFTAGAKVTSGARASATGKKLNEAIKNSDIVVNTKGLINEASISKLKIPEATKIELQAQVKGGVTARVIEVKLRPRSTQDQAIIDKELPYKKIEFVEVTDQFGRAIDRVAIGQVNLKGKSGKTFKQDIISQSEAYITPEGTIEGTTLTALGKEGKGIEKAILTAEKTTGQQIPVKKGAVRIVKTDTGVRLIEAIEGKGRPLTQGELKRLVVEGRGETGNKKISESQFLEIRKRTGLKVEALVANSEALIRKQEKLFGKGVGISSNVLEVPKAKGTSPKTPLSETFKDVPELKKGKNILNEIAKGNRAKTKGTNIKQLEKSIQDVAVPELERAPINVETGVRAALEKGTRNIVKVRNLPVYANLQKNIQLQNLGFDSKQLNALLNNQANQFNQDIASLQKQIQPQQLNVQQVLEQTQAQVPNLQTPGFNIPNFPITDVPFASGGGSRAGGGLKQLNIEVNKKIKKASQYTASLSSAVSGYGVEVDPKKLNKELKKLSQQTFTGLEARPLLKIKSSKKTKKKKKTISL